MSVLLLAVAAFAWNLEAAVWPVEEGPIRYCVDAGSPHGFAAGVPEEAVARAVGMWEAEGVAFELLPVCPPDSAGHLRFEFADDGTFSSTAQTPEVGVVGEVVRGACTYARRDSAVIHIGQGSEQLALPEEVGRPPARQDLVGVLAHAVGHALGLGHSCEPAEPCVDPALVEALMFWSLGPGEVRTITEDDRLGLAALLADCEYPPDDETLFTIDEDEPAEPETGGCRHAPTGLVGLPIVLGALRRRRPRGEPCAAGRCAQPTGDGAPRPRLVASKRVE